MELGTVSSISLIGMLLLAFIGCGGPIIFMVYGTKKLRAQMASFTLGVFTYAIAVVLLKSFVNSLVLGGEGSTLTNDTILYALYAGASAAVFEEVARFFAIRRFMRNRMFAQDGIMFGLGYGSIEAVFTVGFVGIEYFVASIIINVGTMANSFKDMDPELVKESVEAIRGLWEANPAIYYVNAVDAIFVILMHVSLSLLIYKGIKNDKNQYIVVALVGRFAIDALKVILRTNISFALSEIIIVAAVIAVIVYAVKVISDEFIVFKDKKLVMAPVGYTPVPTPKKKEETKKQAAGNKAANIKQIIKDSEAKIEAIDEAKAADTSEENTTDN